MSALLRLSGLAADGYVAVLRALLAVARPGAHYPDPARLDALLALLGPAGSHGRRSVLDLDPRSGLPAIGQLLEVRAEREVARAALAAGSVGDHERAWFRALTSREVLPAADLQVRLRRRERRISYLEIVHDRLDAASGCPLRYTVLLAERGGRHVSFRKAEDVPEASRRFVHLVERNLGADAELAFLLASEIEGVEVEEVVRGQLGPVSMAGLDAPALLAPLIDEAPGAVVLHLAVERAARAVAADSCRDPFTRLYRDALSAEARALVEDRRARLGYRVSKERRLVCTPSAEAPLRALLARERTPLVVRSR